MKQNHRKKLFFGVLVALVLLLLLLYFMKSFNDRSKEAAKAKAESLITEEAPEEADGSGRAGQERIPGSKPIRFETPGWQHDDSGWWYAGSDDLYYKNGWATIDGKKYHFDQDGNMDTGWKAIGGQGYYFDTTGVYQENADASKLIALTFDDGPGEMTSHLLDVLEQNGGKATFFILGEKLEKYGANTVPRMVELGFEIGNHSFDHPNMKKLSTEDALSQFNRAEELLKQLTDGKGSDAVRFPYGSYTAEQEAQVGKPSIYWDNDSLDWKGSPANILADRILKSVQGGEILLFHDIHKNTIEAMDILIPKLIEEGYQLVTVKELASSRGYELEAGYTYYGFNDKEMASGRIRSRKADANS